MAQYKKGFKMNILLYLYYPFFDTHLAGGVQVWLRNLVSEIMKNDSSIHISIYCPDSDLHNYPEDIDVNHILLDLEQDFLTPKMVYNNLLKIKQAEEKADIIWIIDRTFPIKSNKPQLLSLNTICYEREVMSIFQADWKAIACPSDFVLKQLKEVVDDKRKIYKIPYYIDPLFLNEYPDGIDRVKKYFDYKANNKYILFPHRPDRSKGHEEAMTVLEKLLAVDPSYYLLIPQAPDAKVSNVTSENQYIDELKELAQRKGIAQHVIFHKWVEYSDIPSYYAIGQYTLFFSKLPETFGLTLLNSAICGTPVISFGYGALPEIIPPGGLHKVVKEISEVPDIILKELDSARIESDIMFMKNNYLIEKVSEQYLQLFHELIKENG